MNQVIAKAASIVMGVATLILPATRAAAQSEPLLVVTLSGIDEILGDVAYLAQVSGSGPVGQMVSMMANQYVQGLDRTKPIAVVVTVNGDEINPLAMIPVTDLPRFLEGLSQQLGELQDAGNGIFELGTPVPTYVKEQDGWAFVGPSIESLQKLPDDPISAMGGLDTKYDIGIRAVIKNLPEIYKQMALAKINEGIAQQLENVGDELGSKEAQSQKNLVKAQLNQWETMLNEIDELTIGWLVDSKAERIYIDGTTTAIPGTKTADQMAALKDMKSGFTGFVMPGAAATLQAVGELADSDIEQFIAMIDPLRESAKKEIDADDDLPDDEAKQAAKSLVDQLFAVLEETVREGKADLGAALMLENQSMTVLFGFHVADGAKLEKSVKDLVKMAEKDPNFPGIKFNAATEGDVNFHSMEIPVPDDEAARDVFGEQIELIVGIGPKAAYFGFGEGCLGGLRGAIRNSAAATDTSAPMQMSVALGPIMRFASNFEDNPMVAALATALEANQGRDNILIVGEAIPNGAHYRFEVQDGVLKAIGQATQGG